MLSPDIVLLRDNAYPISDGITQDQIQHFGWEQLSQRPYSPNLMPSDYQPFLNMEREFGEEYWHKKRICSLSLQAAPCFEESIQGWIPRYDKCLSHGSNYVEK